MNDDIKFGLGGLGSGKLPITPGIGIVEGGHIGPSGGIGDLPTSGSLVFKPKIPKPPEDGKKA